MEKLIINEPEYRTIEASRKEIFIVKAKRLNITGSENKISLSNKKNTWKLLVFGDENEIYNYESNNIINIIGCNNNINNSSYNLNSNNGVPIISIIIGCNNKYRGVERDRVKLLMPSQPVYIANEKDITIGKDYLSHTDYTFF